MEGIVTPERAFSAYEWKQGKLADLDRQFPSYLSAVLPGKVLPLCHSDTHFGYVESHNPPEYAPEAAYAEIIIPGRADRTIYPGDAFSVKGYGRIHASRGARVVVVSRQDWLGLPYITTVEHEGRLRYIDGCTDSLLIPPVKLGDPCLNLLYFPSGIDQTAHTHPSDRIGLILSGHGLCHSYDNGAELLTELLPGMIFCIHTDGHHKFSTPFGEDMRVLAYHPESDFGPQDENHPMINRTIVEGVSASQIPGIHTGAK